MRAAPRPARRPVCLVSALALAATASVACGAESPARAAPEPAPGAPIVTAIGGTSQGPVAYPGASPSEMLVAARPMPLADILFIDFAAPPAAPDPALIVLRGGDEVFAKIAGGDENELRIRAGSIGSAAAPGGAPSEIAIPLDAIQAVGFPGSYQDPVEGLRGIRRWLAAPRPAAREGRQDAEDRVFLAEGADLSGILKKIDAAAIDFQSSTAGDVKLPLAKVRAVLMSADAPAPKADAKRAPAAAIQAVVQSSDGTTLTGALASLSMGGPGTPGAAVLSTEILGKVSVPIARVRRISIRGGRCRFLSDMEAPKFTPRGDFFTTPALRRDAFSSFDAPGPISIGGRVYKKGIGMHSRSRADWTLGGEYSRFQAEIGIDDSVRLLGAGTAVFRVHVDGRVAFEKEISSADRPLAIDLPVDGAATLGLELDSGRSYLVLGRGDWADARVIKKNGAK